MDRDRKESFATRLRRRLGQVFSSPETRDAPERQIIALTKTIRWALVRKSDHPLRRIARLGTIVRECRRAVRREQEGMRDGLALILLNATFDDPEWAPFWPHVWDASLYGPLAGSYQFSRRLAMVALRMVEQLRATPQLESSEAQMRLLVVARAALDRCAYGFAQAGPKVHGVRLSERFSGRLVDQLRQLARLSGKKRDRRSLSEFRGLRAALLHEEAVRTRRQARHTEFHPEMTLNTLCLERPLFATAGAPQVRLVH